MPDMSRREASSEDSDRRPAGRHFEWVDRAVRLMTHAFFLLLLVLVLAYFGVLWGLVEPGLDLPVP